MWVIVVWTISVYVVTKRRLMAAVLVRWLYGLHCHGAPNPGSNNGGGLTCSSNDEPNLYVDDGHYSESLWEFILRVWESVTRGYSWWKYGDGSHQLTRCVGTDSNATTEKSTPMACDTSHGNEAAKHDKSCQAETDMDINSKHVRKQSPCLSSSPVESGWSEKSEINDINYLECGSDSIHGDELETDCISSSGHTLPHESNPSNNGMVVQRLRDTEAPSNAEQAIMEIKEGPSFHQMEHSNVCDANGKWNQSRPPDIMSDGLQELVSESDNNINKTCTLGNFNTTGTEPGSGTKESQVDHMEECTTLPQLQENSNKPPSSDEENITSSIPLIAGDHHEACKTVHYEIIDNVNANASNRLNSKDTAISRSHDGNSSPLNPVKRQDDTTNESSQDELAGNDNEGKNHCLNIEETEASKPFDDIKHQLLTDALSDKNLEEPSRDVVNQINCEESDVDQSIKELPQHIVPCDPIVDGNANGSKELKAKTIPNNHLNVNRNTRLLDESKYSSTDEGSVRGNTPATLNASDKPLEEMGQVQLDPNQADGKILDENEAKHIQVINKDECASLTENMHADKPMLPTDKVSDSETHFCAKEIDSCSEVPLRCTDEGSDIENDAHRVVQASDGNDEHLISSYGCRTVHVSSGWCELSVDELNSEQESNLPAESGNMASQVDPPASMPGNVPLSSLGTRVPWSNTSYDESAVELIPRTAAARTNMNGPVNSANSSLEDSNHSHQSVGSLEIHTVGNGKQLKIAVRGNGITLHSQHGSYNDQVINLSVDEGYSSSAISFRAGDTAHTADMASSRDGGAAEAGFQKSDRGSLSHVVSPQPETGPAVCHEYVCQKSMVMIQGGESNRQELLTARRPDSTHEGSQSGQKQDTSTEEETDSPYQARTFGQPTSVNVHFESPCDVFLQTGERNRQWIYTDSRLLENKRAYRQRSLNMTILLTPGLCNAPPGVHVHMTTYVHPVPVVTSGEQSSVRSINNGVVDSLRNYFRVFGLEMLTVNPKGYGYTFTFWTDEVNKAIDTLKMYNCHIKEMYCRTLLIDERVCDSSHVRCTFWKSESYSGNKEFIITL